MINNFFFILVEQDKPLQAPAYDEPMTITSGGIYHNLRVESKDSNTPAITIATDEAVTLIKPHTISAGTHIHSTDNIDLTIQRGYGEGTTPTVDNRTNGRYLYAENWRNIVVDNCKLVHTAGIDARFYAGNRTSAETIKIRKNDVVNIDGRNRYGNQLGSGYYRQFVQLNRCLGLVGAEIAWNKVVNEYGNSLIEDVLNFFMSGGAEGNNLLVHNNYFDGSFPLTGNHSGGGIMCDATHDIDTGECTMFVEAYNNYLIRTANYALAIMGGHDNVYHNNQVVYSGYINGAPVNGNGNNGMQVYNYNHPSNGRTPAELYYNNRALNNIVGYVNSKTNDRQDKYFPTFVEDGVTYQGCEDCNANNTYIPGDVAAITTALEDSKLALWEAAAASAGMIIGNY